jgi:hypothetical protein
MTEARIERVAEALDIAAQVRCAWMAGQCMAEDEKSGFRAAVSGCFGWQSSAVVGGNNCGGNVVTGAYRGRDYERRKE